MGYKPSNWIALMLLGAGLLSACQPDILSPSPIPSATLTPAPTPTFIPARDFVDGSVVLPPGRYLFVEAWTDRHGQGNCENLMIDFPTYYFNDGFLNGSLDLSADDSVVGFFGIGYSNSGTAGGGVSSELHPIQVLPYHAPDNQFTIHNVDSRGVIVVSIQNETFYMEPGKYWSQQTEHVNENGCQITTHYFLRNYGAVMVSVGNFQSPVADECPGLASQRNRLAWSSDGNWLAYGGGSGVIMFDLTLKTTIRSWLTDAPVTSLAVSPRSPTIAFATADGALHLADFSENAVELSRDANLIEPAGPWTSVAFSPDGRILASGAADERIVLWEVETQIANPWSVSSGGENRCVRSLAFSSDGGRFLVDAGDQNTEVWSIQNGKLAGINIGGLSKIDGPRAISPDGSQVAAAGKNGNLYILTATTGEIEKSWPGAYQNVRSIQFSPDGALLATGSDYGWVQSWEVDSGINAGSWQIGKKDWHQVVVTVVFSPDGQKLAALSRVDGQTEIIWLLDLVTGETFETSIVTE